MFLGTMLFLFTISRCFICQLYSSVIICINLYSFMLPAEFSSIKKVVYITAIPKSCFHRPVCHVLHPIDDLLRALVVPGLRQGLRVTRENPCPPVHPLVWGPGDGAFCVSVRWSTWCCVWTGRGGPRACPWGPPSCWTGCRPPRDRTRGEWPRLVTGPELLSELKNCEVKLWNVELRAIRVKPSACITAVAAVLPEYWALFHMHKPIMCLLRMCCTRQCQ